MNAPRLEEHSIRLILSRGFIPADRQADFIANMTDEQHEFMLQSQRYLFTHGYSNKAFEMWRKYRHDMTEWYAKRQMNVELGHLVVIKCESGREYQNATVTSVDLQDEEIVICTQPYIPFTRIQPDGGLGMSTSGGYFHEVKFTDFENMAVRHPDMRLKTFCEWGPNGACQDGAFYADVPVTVWLIDDSAGKLGFY